MGDVLFEEGVIESMRMFRGWRACCSSCGSYQTADKSEFAFKSTLTEETLRYVAEMRAWNCCRDDETPLDGFPEQPDKFELLAAL